MNLNGKSFKRVLVFVVFIFVSIGMQTVNSFATEVNTPAVETNNELGIPGVSVNINPGTGETEVVSTLQLLFMITIISIAPFLLLMLTCFPRILIVMHFLRSALGTQQMPPNQVLIGISLFLTLFLMGPIFNTINETAIKPYSQGQLSQEVTMTTAMEPLREYMFKQVDDKNMRLFIRLSGESYNSPEEIPNRVLIPAYMLGELTIGFTIGFLIYIPFLVIDMVVASVLMAMGMMMLPPAMISLPFKLLLFVMVDGWSLVIQSLVNTFK